VNDNAAFFRVPRRSALVDTDPRCFPKVGKYILMA
jgi:hypothetical protein